MFVKEELQCHHWSAKWAEFCFDSSLWPLRARGLLVAIVM
jgi:hypothetical protein